MRTCVCVCSRHSYSALVKRLCVEGKVEQAQEVYATSKSDRAIHLDSEAIDMLHAPATRAVWRGRAIRCVPVC